MEKNKTINVYCRFLIISRCFNGKLFFSVISQIDNLLSILNERNRKYHAEVEFIVFKGQKRSIKNNGTHEYSIKVIY